MKRFPVQTTPDARLGLGTQPRNKARSDLRVKYVRMQQLTLDERGCPLDNRPKLVVGQRSNSQKITIPILLMAIISSF